MYTTELSQTIKSKICLSLVINSDISSTKLSHIKRNIANIVSCFLYCFIFNLLTYKCLSMRNNPINESRCPGIDAWVSGLSAANSPGDNSAVNSVAGHGATRVSLARVNTLSSSTDHGLREHLVLTVGGLAIWNMVTMRNIWLWSIEVQISFILPLFKSSKIYIKHKKFRSTIQSVYQVFFLWWHNNEL